MKQEISITKSIELLKNKEITVRDFIDPFHQVAKKNKYNSFISVTADDKMEHLIQHAQNNIDNKVARPLEGIPIGVKDLFCTRDLKTTCGSKMLENFQSPYESSVTQALINAGAIVIGKLNMDEFAMGSSNVTSHFGPCVNPWKGKNNNKQLVPGGSSGGSAVSIVEKSSLASLGSDTGGSVRQPAALCGIVGIKPTYGTCSRHGMVAYASSLDQPGVMSDTVENATKVLKIMSFFDHRDPTSIPQKLRINQLDCNIDKPLTGLRVGIPKEYNISGLLPSIYNHWVKTAETMATMGAEIKDISLPNTALSIATYYIVSTAEASSNLARFDGIKYGYKGDNDSTLNDLYLSSRTNGFGDEVKRRIMLGTFVLSSESYEKYYRQALKIRQMIKNDFDAAFQQVDLLLCPTTPNVAFGMDEKISDPLLMYLNDVLTVPVNLAGLPAANIPVGIDDQTGLPIGMQIVAPQMHDHIMIQAAKQVELWANFANQHNYMNNL